MHDAWTRIVCEPRQRSVNYWGGEPLVRMGEGSLHFMHPKRVGLPSIYAVLLGLWC